MTSEDLKIRAKRLRPAIAEMFKIKVTHSQSLELVAREDNFPNWDAASACSDHTSDSPRNKATSIHSNITVRWGAPQTLSTIFGKHQELTGGLVQSLTEPDAGSLVLIASLTANGKSTTANALLEAALVAGQHASAAAHVEVQERVYPSNVNVYEFRDPGSVWSSGSVAETLILVDEIRTPSLAFEVVTLVHSGKKVVATISASTFKVMARLQALLDAFGAGNSILDGLIEARKVRTVYQEMEWADASDVVAARNERNRSMLQGAGVSEVRIELLESRGELHDVKFGLAALTAPPVAK